MSYILRFHNAIPRKDANYYGLLTYLDFKYMIYDLLQALNILTVSAGISSQRIPGSQHKSHRLVISYILVLELDMYH